MKLNFNIIDYQPQRTLRGIAECVVLTRLGSKIKVNIGGIDVNYSITEPSKWQRSAEKESYKDYGEMCFECEGKVPQEVIDALCKVYKSAVIRRGETVYIRLEIKIDQGISQQQLDDLLAETRLVNKLVLSPGICPNNVAVVERFSEKVLSILLDASVEVEALAGFLNQINSFAEAYHHKFALAIL